LIEPNFFHAYPVFCRRICFIQVLDMKLLNRNKAGTETGGIAGHKRLAVSRSVPLSVRVRTCGVSYAVAG
jgi:hypothetical protein